jgi:iron-sulfur cluster repair protein YtfE (RIC family)
MKELMMTNETLMQMTVNEMIRRFPATVDIFKRFGIDACCGGAAAVADAAVRHGADPVALRTELLRVVGQAA